MNATLHDISQCDVLVIGGGGAGIRAALTAAEAVESVMLISETPVGESGSTFYPLSFEWGMLSATDEKDAEDFTQEILTAAKGCINPRLASYLAHGSINARARFIEEGLPLTPMKSMRITGCFGKEPRGDFLRDMNIFVKSQQELVSQNPHITFRRLTAVSLLVRNGRCLGAMAVDAEGCLCLIRAKAVILAMGGGEGLYQHRAAFGPLYGNAYAMAARHQARIVNLEFIQFVPGTVKPIANVNYFPFLLNEHPRLTNAKDESCMEAYLPKGVTVENALDLHAKHGPFSCEDNGKYLEYAMVAENEKGNGMGLKFWPDASRLQDERGVHWREFLHKLGLDEGTVMQIYPMCQGFNGGILLGDDLSTDIEGLFACGESSGGLHGPDRMGGLCILATQVFGEGAGRMAGEYALERQETVVSEQDALQMLINEFSRRRSTGSSPVAVLEKIRCIMQENGCIRRNKKGLEEGLSQLEALDLQPLEHLGTPEAAQYFQVANAVDAARLILTAMKNRKESRGSHDRSDYPVHDEALNFLISQGMQEKMSFDIMESVRKGRGLKPEWEEAMREHNVPQWAIDSCHKIKYMFPRGHAVAYVTMGLRVAWYKVYRPAAYYAAYFSIRGDGFDAAKMLLSNQTLRSRIEEFANREEKISIKDKQEENALHMVLEMQERGIRMLPVDLYKSHANRFLPEEGGLRCPFTAINGLGEAAIQGILDTRDPEKPYISIEDLQARAHVGTSVIEMLRLQGALEGLPATSQVDLFSLL